MPTACSDPELIAACISGQAWAWDTLVDRYKRLIYSVASRAGLGEEDTADVFQSVFTALLEKLHSIRDPQALGAWLITTTKRQSWSLLRKRQRESPASDQMAERIANADEWLSNTRPEESRWLDQSLVRDALEHLKQRCRRLLWLLYYDRSEPSYQQISHQLKMPLGSVGPTRARCLQKMREILHTMGMSET